VDRRKIARARNHPSLRGVASQDETGELSWPLVDRRQGRTDPPSGRERRNDIDQDAIDQLSSANQLLLSLQKIAITLPSSLDLETVLDQAVAQVPELVGADIVTILLANKDATRLTIVRGRGSANLLEIAVKDLPPHIRESLDLNRSIAVRLSRLEKGFAEEARAGAYCALRSRGMIVGLIAAEWRVEQDLKRQTQVLTGVADALGVAVDNAHIFRDIRRQSASDERRRIARDLHDRTGSGLAFVGLELDRLQRNENDEQTRVEISAIREQVGLILTEVREMLFDLRVGLNGEVSLYDTIVDLSQRVTSRSRTVVSYELSDLPELDAYLSNEMWEIIKEAIINAERHSQGTKIQITSVVTDSLWTLSIIDNGIGIQLENKRPDSYGLTGVLERAETIGAKLVIESPLRNKDYGTAVFISLPVSNNGDDNSATTDDSSSH
jgi:signal transduction histidine kinase